MSAAEITTKFAIGDTVYRADTERKLKQHPCPDCLGTRKWKAISPAGCEYDFDCPRCRAGYQSERDLSLEYQTHAPSVQKLTIGSIRYNSYDTEKPVTYMCRETGVGSGQVHREQYLFATEEEAQRAAETLALTRDQSGEQIAKLYDKSLQLSDYQLNDATLKAARDFTNGRRTDIQILFEDLRDAETIDAVKFASKAILENRAEAAWQAHQDTLAESGPPDDSTYRRNMIEAGRGHLLR